MIFHRLKRKLETPFPVFVGEDASRRESGRRLPILPPELIILIISFVDNTPTLTSCACSCIAIHDLAIPRLYNTIELGLWRTNDYALFFDSLQPSFPYPPRKLAYLRHLEHLILWRPPASDLFLPYRGPPDDLFPSLHTVQFHAVEGIHGLHIHDYDPLFSMFAHVRHVCIYGYQGKEKPSKGSIDYWGRVESVSFLHWKSTKTLWVPHSWRKLRNIDIYPDLDADPSPYSYALPQMIGNLPSRDHYKFLQAITLFVPHTDEPSRVLLTKYLRQFGQRTRGLVWAVVEELRHDRWAEWADRDETVPP